MLDHPEAVSGGVLDEVLRGLSQTQKRLPAKLFYDVEGCRLFEEITRLPEYYVTRVEKELLDAVIPQIPSSPGCAVIEYGGSNETKALPLIDQLEATTYIPIDVAEDALQRVRMRLSKTRKNLVVCTIPEDFLSPFTLPQWTTSLPKFGFFPGSTIGNLEPCVATKFLRDARRCLGPDGMFLIGVDLAKSPEILVPAYNDSLGITAAFNRNVLVNVNRLIGSDFDPQGFEHRAIWNMEQSRIEMHLISLKSQSVQIADKRISLVAGESIHTENSYKHTIEAFVSIVEAAGWRSRVVWTDKSAMYSIHLLDIEDAIG